VTAGRDQSLLALAAELARRDEAVAEELAEVDELLGLVDEVRDRALALRAFLESVPAELEALVGGETDARAMRETAENELAEAERELAELRSKRRRADERRHRAESELARAGDRVRDLDARLERLVEEQARLLREQQVRTAEAQRLAAEARALAGRIRSAPRVSESGKADPGAELGELVDWGGRAHAALFVVRGGLALERERVVREAGELGTIVLGEQVGGAGVGAVTQLIERALRT
jgi:chromosome segregation ATPase